MASSGYIGHATNHPWSFERMPSPTFAEMFQATKPSVDLPPMCTSAMLICEFADGSVHAGVALGGEDDADRLINAAGDLYGLHESGVADLHNVHYPIDTAAIG